MVVRLADGLQVFPSWRVPLPEVSADSPAQGQPVS